MDDTELKRPPRHERATVERRAPAAVATEAIDVDAAVPCATCGHDVQVLASGALPPALVRVARQQAAGELPVLCVACSDIAEAEADEAEQRALAEEQVARRRAASGIPAMWQPWTWDSMEADEQRRLAVERARQWGSGELRGIVLWGDVGRGKTAIAAAAANDRLRVGAVRWLPVGEMLTDLRMPFDSPEYARAVRQLDPGRRDVALVLDDLDKLKPSEHAVQPIYVAVNAWIEAELPLLVTLNRNLDALADWMPDTFGEALSSRLSGYCKVYEVKGTDRRLG